MALVKHLPANAGDIRIAGLIPGLGRSPVWGHGNTFQYSCLENPRDREAWWAMVYRVAKSWTWLRQFGEQLFRTQSNWGKRYQNKYVWQCKRKQRNYFSCVWSVSVIYHHVLIQWIVVSIKAIQVSTKSHFISDASYEWRQLQLSEEACLPESSSSSQGFNRKGRAVSARNNAASQFPWTACLFQA